MASKTLLPPASSSSDRTNTTNSTTTTAHNNGNGNGIAIESKVVASSTHTNYVDSIAIRNDVLAVGTSSLTGDHWNGEVVLVSLPTLTPLHRISSYGGISSVNWTSSSDHKSLLLGGGDEAITYIWSVHDTSNDTTSTNDDGHKKPAKKGKGAASKTNETKSASPLSALSSTTRIDTKVVATLHEHCDVISAITVNTIRTSLVATASYDRTVRVWDISSPSASVTTFNHDDQVLSSSWQPSSSSSIATGTRTGCTSIWDSRTPSSVSLAISSSSGIGVTALSWMHGNNDTLCMGNESGHIQLVDIRAAHRVLSTNTSHRAAIRSLSWNGALLSSSSDDTTVRIFHFNSSSLSTCDVIIGHTDYVRSALWYTGHGAAATATATTSSGGSHIITAGWDKSIRMYTPRTIPLPLPPMVSSSSSLATSPTK